MIADTRWQVRSCAGAIALLAVIGLVAQYIGELRNPGSPMAHAWTMVRYFTNITGVLTAIVFGRIGIGAAPIRHSWLLPGVVFSAMLVGSVNALLLTGLEHPSPAAKLADLLLHDLLPIAAPLFWVAFAQKGLLRHRDPWLWAALPVAYLAYALARGSMEGVYPYPFIDVAAIGWARTATNALGIAVGFLGLGTLVVLLDRWLTRWDRG